MKKFMTALMVFSLVLAGASLVAAAELPQALQGVDLSKAKQVTDQEAQEVRGSMNEYPNWGGNAYAWLQDGTPVRTRAPGENCTNVCPNQ